MEGQLILAQIQGYLQKANEGKPGMSEEIIQEAGEALKGILRKTFNESQGPFRLRMSNVGKPACQLVMERNGAAKEAQPYSFRMKMIIGDISEIVLRAVMKACGVKIGAEMPKVTLKLPNGFSLNGTPDLSINNSIWDIKSSSNWGFTNKWKAGFKYIEEHDTFGYCAQLFGYAEARNEKAGGWFVLNKETGEILCVEANDSPELRKKHLDKLNTNLMTVLDVDKPFQRNYEDEEETFYRKATGNRKLGVICGFCEYKWSCWPGLKMHTAVKSEARNPKMVYYSVWDPKSEDVEAKIENK